jgi:hypothetical protein
MVPTLAGRLQTRLFLLATVGSLVTLLIAPDGFVTLGVVAALGIAWELVYQLLMQFRWEKDWPTLFGLLTAVPEGALVWAVLRPPIGQFIVHFGAVWLAVWVVANGPMRVPFLRWRFRGGRVL